MSHSNTDTMTVSGTQRATTKHPRRPLYAGEDCRSSRRLVGGTGKLHEIGQLSSGDVGRPRDQALECLDVSHEPSLILARRPDAGGGSLPVVGGFELPARSERNRP